MPRSKPIVPALLAGFAALILAACSPAAKLARNPEMPYPPEQPPVVGKIIHLPTGKPVAEAQMLAIVSDSRIVYVGETHDNPASHRQELAVLTALAERYPGQVAMGMEMFTPSQQPVLDRWVAGELDEKAFLKQSRWYDTWRMDYELYRPLLEFARRHKIPVVGLNAEKTLVKAVGQFDFSELPEQIRSQLPEMDFNDPYQRQLVEAIYGGHAHGNSQLDGFLRVQTLWDETMAHNVAAYLGAPGREKTRMLVVAGGNHVRFGFGIPRRVFRRLPSSYSLVGSREIVIPEDKQDRLMDVEIPEFPMLPYDFLQFTEYEDLDKQEVRLGVMLGGEEDGVRVQGVLPGSAAEAAGLTAGDRLLSLDGAALEENFDLVYAVKQKRPGDRALLEVAREGEKLTLEVLFTATPAHGHGKHPPAPDKQD
ncbi:hypothetical protein DESUT3_09850 [Desulfuromonas versatilis]|uniref:PDZ domain-containing protein n=1 Tax=Desulfuromonas versatilis TaxID=2802975 RepID=A0ABN6DUW8_9BACT|nr:ChaN family lipoprotein [Desulfuromonas versatilis]BCR03916.1 hypothetical protein DESUT3_09850 [Desulfuromonas versatilis]